MRNQIRLRDDHKLMTTTYGNEIAKSLNDDVAAAMPGGLPALDANEVYIAIPTEVLGGGEKYLCNIFLRQVLEPDSDGETYSGNDASGGDYPLYFSNAILANLANPDTGSHLLELYKPVLCVFTHYVKEGPTFACYTKPAGVLVNVASTLTGGGLYTGTVYGGTASLASGGNLALPAGLTAGQTVTILNPEENATPTHWIAVGSYIECDHTGGVDTDQSDRPLLTVSGPPSYRTDSPVTFGAESEGTTTPDEKTWNRATATSGSAHGDKPLELYVTCRVVYDDAGDETLYAMIRKLTFDAGGRLVSVGDERQITIDAPEDCP